ncbi:nickel pincer cofactor biosynthesis protein LarB [Myxococcota bacterium]|nr:nickel pincer cofactor biosynthesis protein LarB [Myxococcota bacterium]
MDSETLRKLFEAVRAGGVEIDEAIRRVSVLPFLELEHGRVDTHRALRQGIPEVVFGQGKTAPQIVDLARALRGAGQSVLVTRVAPEIAKDVMEALPEADHHAPARTLWLGPAEVPIVGKGKILVVSAGSADRPVATEAYEVARRFGNEVELLQDVGVAGIHRLFASLDRIRAARVLIVVAGMEGALPSVVGGLVDKPVIAVPTSVGYGAALGGVAALLGMLTSCASNVTVVNIDNGFGAAHVATLINRL